MRALIALVVVLLLAGAGVFAYLSLNAAPKETPRPDLFVALESRDPVAVAAALEGGAELHVRNAAGLTPLMAAVGAGAEPALLETLLAAGAALDEQAASGTTALMLAASSGTPAQVVHLLNAGADPTLTDLEGRTAADLARGNPQVRTSGAFPRLLEAAAGPFVKGWPTGYVVPVEGATISSRRSHLPGAPRAYRNGTHEGFDFYSGTVSVPIEYGTPINAVADGKAVSHVIDRFLMGESRRRSYVRIEEASLTGRLRDHDLLEPPPMRVLPLALRGLRDEVELGLAPEQTDD